MNFKYKKLLLAVAAVPIVGLAGYQAYSFTSALFSDTEVNTANIFTAGTLDMDVDGNNGTVFESFSISNIGVDGVVSGGKTWTITNSGSVPGNLTFRLNDLTNLENDCNEPEALVDTTCDDPGSGQGDLGPAIAVTVDLDKDGSGAAQSPAEVVSSTFATANQSVYASQWNTNAGTVTIPAGGEVTVTMDWVTDPTSYGNEIQSDSLTFGVQFDLLQVVPN